MRIDRSKEHEIRRLHDVEKWKPGTIVAQLGVHADVVERVLDRGQGRALIVAPRPSLRDPYESSTRRSGPSPAFARPASGTCSACAAKGRDRALAASRCPGEAGAVGRGVPVDRASHWRAGAGRLGSRRLARRHRRRASALGLCHGAGLLACDVGRAGRSCTAPIEVCPGSATALPGSVTACRAVVVALAGFGGAGRGSRRLARISQRPIVATARATSRRVRDSIQDSSRFKAAARDPAALSPDSPYSFPVQDPPIVEKMALSCGVRNAEVRGSIPRCSTEFQAVLRLLARLWGRSESVAAR